MTIQTPVTYEVARRAKSNLLGDTVETQARYYKQLPAYLEALVDSNSGVYYTFLTDERNHRFRRVFICPNETANSFRLIRGLVATDGTYLKGFFVHTQGSQQSGRASPGLGLV